MTCALTLLASARLGAQDIQERGRRVIEEALEALGGEAFQGIQNRIEEGRVYGFRYGELSGLARTTVYTNYVAVDPGESGTELAQQYHLAYGEDHDYYEVIREEGGWEVTYRGPAPLDPREVDQYKNRRINDLFYILQLRYDEPGLFFESQGSRVIDNMPLEIVDIIDSQNRVVTAYFHQTTKLPVRQDWVWRDPETRERNEEVTRFSRYQEVDGIQWPTQIHRERNETKVYELFVETLQFNQQIDEQRFAIPDEDSRPMKR